jgi:hypothetical protein
VTKLDDCTGDPVADWPMTLYNSSGVVDSGTTNSAGYWEVCGLAVGDYWVCEGLLPGWTNVTPLCQNVTLVQGNESVEFSNIPPFCINVTKINDHTGQPVADWPMTLYNSSGVVDSGTTGPEGYWEVCGLAVGDYWVTEDLLTGWTNVTPLTQNVTLDCSNKTVEFSNIPPFCINVTKLNNCTGDPVADWPMTLYNSSGVVDSGTTNSAGYWEVCGLAVGDYWVCEDLLPGWTNVTPLCQNVTLVRGNESVEFSNIPPFCINVTKINDHRGLRLSCNLRSVKDFTSTFSI